MININLLPKELRKKKASFKMPNVTVAMLPIGITVVVVLAIVHLLTWFVGSTRKQTDRGLEKDWAALSPEKRKVDKLKAEVRTIDAKVDAIDQLMVNRVLWSKNLNSLSDSMIPGVWLTRLSLGEKRLAARRKPVPQKNARARKGDQAKPDTVRYFKIEGNASSEYGDETATVGKFIVSLKENDDFYDDFYDIELELMQRSVIKEVEVMKFTVVCYFKGEKK